MILLAHPGHGELGRVSPTASSNPGAAQNESWQAHGWSLVGLLLSTALADVPRPGYHDHNPGLARQNRWEAAMTDLRRFGILDGVVLLLVLAGAAGARF